MRRSRMACCLVVAGLAASSCGSDDAATEARIARERADAAQDARQAERIRDLERKADTFHRSRHSKAAPGADPATAPPAPATSGSAGGGQVPDSGVYAGAGVQRGARTETSKDYPVTMSFASTGSSVDYPSLGCHGTLVPEGFRSGRRVYAERITSGGCDQGGRWEVLVVSDSELEASWSSPTTDYSVVASLTR